MRYLSPLSPPASFRPGGRIFFDIHECVTLYRAGKSLTDLQAIYRRRRHDIRDAMRAAGVKIRSRATASAIHAGSLDDRINARLIPDGDCLRWTGCVCRNSTRGRLRYGDKSVNVLRHMFTRGRRTLAANQWLVNTCGAPWCHNPQHYRAVQQGQHATGHRSADTRVRMAIASRNRPGTKLTAEKVLALRASHAAGEPMADIAARYGIALRYAYRVARGLTWQQLPR